MDSHMNVKKGRRRDGLNRLRLDLNRIIITEARSSSKLYTSCENKILVALGS
jgi:hypothetical protein